MKKIILFIILSSLIVFGIFITKDNSNENIENNEEYTENNQNIKENTDNNDDVEDNENNYVEQPKSYLNEITYTANISKDVEKLIVEYFDVYYKIMKELKEYDMTYLFSNNSDDALINQAAMSLLVKIRTLKPNDLRLSKVKYDLEIESVESLDNEIKITVLESNYLNFNFMSEIESRVYNIKNEFTISKIDNEYKIIKYNKVQDFYVMITDKYTNTANLNSIIDNYLVMIKNNIENDKKAYNDFINGNVGTITCDHSFDRKKALDYALKWVKTRNPEWIKYSSNCQNFASQVLYVGGIPMDYIGSDKDYLQWKSYDGSYNESEVASGLVYTWTYVPYFREYALNNTGYGLCASVDANIYTAEAGDVIHVGTSGPTRHAMVSIGTYKKDNKILDVLVNSNTVDLENFPLSAYMYPYVSLIKIHGWNE